MFAGHTRVVAFAWFVLFAALGLAADEPSEKAAKDAQPAEIACPDEQPEVADDPEKIQYCIETAARLRLENADANGSSHRRQTERERLHDKSQSSVVDRQGKWAPNHQGFYGRERPPITLTEAMRRVAGWGECCPLCGKSHSLDSDTTGSVPSTQAAPVAGRQELDYSAVGKQAGNATSPSALRTGEPAQIILDTQKRLGNSVLDGTEFGGSPELLIQWIRALDEENRRRQATQQARQFESIPVTVPEELPVTSHSQVSALREACRQLQEAAELLEEQNLFESADSLRAAADNLRQQARERIDETKESPSNDN